MRSQPELRKDVRSEDLSSTKSQRDKATSLGRNLFLLNSVLTTRITDPENYYHHLYLPTLPFTQPKIHPEMATASSALLSPATFSSAASNPRSISFHGLRPIRLGGSSSAAPRLSSTARRPSSAAVVKAELSPSVVISLSTGLSLFLGRFVFFNFQRENVAKQGLPEQNGKTHFEAGDDRAKEYVSLLKSNDPVGFNIVDVLAWGSIGHIVAYYILATSSNGYDPKFFG
ncbi:PREDICTED: photosystem I reaction center subunit V, chloroplastic [Tarenaya hassleriana]|uniref:photosystem I reaction center subunit V, chloroplastic n=1 Tax=Tarenaya hassleriana TaxID=28532 RepID=UPI0008FD11BE|nr:PREDICTED: photosystem I reaction center subunit V, chloroplastic [Tarenaya hassleriana]